MVHRKFTKHGITDSQPSEFNQPTFEYCRLLSHLILQVCWHQPGL